MAQLMTQEKLQRANQLVKNIEQCKEDIRNINYTQREEVKIRPMYLHYNGIDGQVTIPDTLFRIVGKLVLNELSCMLKEYELELESL